MVISSFLSIFPDLQKNKKNRVPHQSWPYVSARNSIFLLEGPSPEFDVPLCEKDNRKIMTIQPSNVKGGMLDSRNFMVPLVIRP
jgi:hypothetical protein